MTSWMVPWQQLSLLEYSAFAIILLATFISARKVVSRLDKNQQQRKWLILLSHSIAVIGLAGLILQPQMETTQRQSVRLVTSPVPAPSVPYPSFFLPQTGEGLTQEQLSRLGEPLQLAEQLLERQPGLGRLEIIGDGLTANQWQKFAPLTVDYEQPESIEGLVEASWRKQINLGSLFHFQARVQSASKAIFTAKLFDPAGGKVAEATVLAGEYLSLSAKPKTVGNHIYQVELSDNNGNLIAQEQVPLAVFGQAKADILVIQSAPSFEVKQLQNWAGETGARLLVKTKISQDRYLTKQINFEQQQESGLQQTMLQRFDLLLIDGRSLVEMADIEKEWLGLAIEQGLGVIVLADSQLVEAYKNIELLSGYQLTIDKDAGLATPYWSDNLDGLVAAQEAATPVVPARLTSDKSKLLDPQTLVQDRNGRPLLISSNYGMGKIAVSLLKESYRWVTAGDKNSHSHYWQNLIAHLGRGRSIAQWQSEDSLMKYAASASRVCFTSADKLTQASVSLPVSGVGQLEVLLESNAAASGKFCGQFWPQTSGWHQAVLDSQEGSPAFAFYVFDRERDWLASQQADKISATLAKQQALDTKEALNIIPSKRPVNPWIFWWLMLIAASVIWLERKFE